jgi:class 3 adenylate cyclase
VKNLGDGFSPPVMVLLRAIRCATAISDAVQPLGIAVRSGLHIGEIELTADDVTCIGVHIAARVTAEAQAGETVVSSTARDLVASSELRFRTAAFMRSGDYRMTFTLHGSPRSVNSAFGRCPPTQRNTCTRRSAYPMLGGCSLSPQRTLP